MDIWVKRDKFLKQINQKLNVAGGGYFIFPKPSFFPVNACANRKSAVSGMRPSNIVSLCSPTAYHMVLFDRLVANRTTQERKPKLLDSRRLKHLLKNDGFECHFR